MVLVPRKRIELIPPYQQGDKPLFNQTGGIKLSANESALGPSPKVKGMMLTALDSLQWYPDPNAVSVRDSIAKRYNLDFAKILMGVGSDELLKNLIASFSGYGDEVIFSDVTFPLYKTYTLAAGATPVIVPNIDFTVDIEGIIKFLSPKTSIVIIANPNNPTGTYINNSQLGYLRDKLPEKVLLIIDSAYAEYVDSDEYDSGAKLVDKTLNTVMTRTFSKIHGLASLRLGWCYGHQDILSVLGRIRSPFNVSEISQKAGEVAVEDRNFQSEVFKHNNMWKKILIEELTNLGFYFTGTEGNFLSIGKTKSIRKNIEDIDKFLRSNNIITRSLEFFGLPNHLRVTIGKGKDMEIFLEVLKGFIK